MGRLRLMKAMCLHKHTHPINQCRKYKFRAVAEYINSLPSYLPIASMKHLICPQFAITEKQLYYIISKKKSQPIPAQEFIRILEAEKY